MTTVPYLIAYFETGFIPLYISINIFEVSFIVSPYSIILLSDTAFNLKFLAGEKYGA